MVGGVPHELVPSVLLHLDLDPDVVRLAHQQLLVEDELVLSLVQADELLLDASGLVARLLQLVLRVVELVFEFSQGRESRVDVLLHLPDVIANELAVGDVSVDPRPDGAAGRPHVLTDLGEHHDERRVCAVGLPAQLFAVGAQVGVAESSCLKLMWQSSDVGDAPLYGCAELASLFLVVFGRCEDNVAVEAVEADAILVEVLHYSPQVVGDIREGVGHKMLHLLHQFPQLVDIVRVSVEVAAEMVRKLDNLLDVPDQREPSQVNVIHDRLDGSYPLACVGGSVLRGAVVETFDPT